MNRSKAKGKRGRKVSVDRGRQSRHGALTNRELALRKTGIRVMGDMPWGTHICVFYETKKDLLDTAVSYFQAGLESNEFCVWAVSDTIPLKEATSTLRNAIPEFEKRLSAGQIQLLRGREWYLKGDQFDLKKITGGWSKKLRTALAKGYAGMRVSGDAFWIASNYWTDFCAYEQELDQTLNGRKMIVLCTYSLLASRAVDVLDVARSHQCTIARRNKDWEFFESPELKQSKREIMRLHDALDILSKPFPGQEALTTRERVVLAQIVRGASNKEAAHTLGVSPRTIEFHRANVMKKLRAKNTVDLVRKVLRGKWGTDEQ